MSFCGYDDFDSCVRDQLKKGKSPSSAEKICGSLMHKYEEKQKSFKERLKRLNR